MRGWWQRGHGISCGAVNTHCERRLFLRDFECFFFGTAMTVPPYEWSSGVSGALSDAQPASAAQRGSVGGVHVQRS
jgi:hypothetical protein